MTKNEREAFFQGFIFAGTVILNVGRERTMKWAERMLVRWDLNARNHTGELRPSSEWIDEMKNTEVWEDLDPDSR